MEGRPLHVGIDLGTTNSTVATFDGADLVVVRNAQGTTLTPSVVRVDARGNVVVRARARRFLDSDPANTRGEFKRLMGTSHRLDFPASASSRSPQELSAEVLKSLRRDVLDQLGVMPERAVISVPALFELPQTSATSEAARLAGFESVELIQEPVASAIASGWSSDAASGAWLVYDLGGGTFDVSLLETREGLLRVIGHDGDNFLGGRDLDSALVAWVIAKLAEDGIQVDRANPAHAPAVGRLRLAAEEARIELTRAREATVSVQGLQVGDERADVDVTVTRDDYEALAMPLVDRTLVTCMRLLESHGIDADSLERVVLVGGPTVTPILRSRVAEVLGTRFAENIDPMTLVAQGAAIFAGTAGLDARPAPPPPAITGPKTWLQYPAMTSDLSPYVVGKLLDRASGVVAVQLSRDDGSWQGARESVDADATFAASVSLLPRQRTTFRLHGALADGSLVALHPETVSITHGLTIGEPPLSRSVGIALADNTVHVYLERGSPLPLRRTFMLRTADTIRPGASGPVLKVPIVQGEFGRAHLCRLVGSLEIPGSALTAPVIAGTNVEITLALDRGGELHVTARIEGVETPFDHVAILVTPSISIEALEGAVVKLRERTAAMRASAFGRGATQAVARLSAVEGTLAEIDDALVGVRGGDVDSAERARRALADLDGALAEIEADEAWPELADRIEREHALALPWMAYHGTDAEREALSKACEAARRALASKNADAAERHVNLMHQLGVAAYLRHPKAWDWELDYRASRVSESTDIRRATSLVDEGRRAASQGDRAALERVVRELTRLDPVDRDEQELGYASGLRSR